VACPKIIVGKPKKDMLKYNETRVNTTFKRFKTSKQVEIRRSDYVKIRNQKRNLLIDNFFKVFFRDYFIF
jgi:hypothetical protein